MVSSSQRHRLATIVELVKRKPRAGRTALVKWLYLLKTLKKVPLAYNFRLYTYGPFDVGVLEDLQYAEAIGAVESEAVPYPGGYGYEFALGTQADWILDEESDYLVEQGQNIDWVLQEFGQSTAVQLEVASTIVYVDQRRLALGGATIDDVVERVHGVKPHRSKRMIREEADRIRGYLHCVQR